MWKITLFVFVFLSSCHILFLLVSFSVRFHLIVSLFHYLSIAVSLAVSVFLRSISVFFMSIFPPSACGLSLFFLGLNYTHLRTHTRTAADTTDVKLLLLYVFVVCLEEHMWEIMPLEPHTPQRTLYVTWTLSRPNAYLQMRKVELAFSLAHIWIFPFLGIRVHTCMHLFGFSPEVRLKSRSDCSNHSQWGQCTLNDRI